MKRLTVTVMLVMLATVAGAKEKAQPVRTLEGPGSTEKRTLEGPATPAVTPVQAEAPKLDDRGCLPGWDWLDLAAACVRVLDVNSSAFPATPHALVIRLDGKIVSRTDVVKPAPAPPTVKP